MNGEDIGLRKSEETFNQEAFNAHNPSQPGESTFNTSENESKKDSTSVTTNTYEHESKTNAILLTTAAPTITTYKVKTRSNGVVFTSWYTYDKDPQRGKKVPETINYIWNFYMTARFLGINAVIFHDHLPPDFISKHTTDKISFEKVTPTKSFSTNDLRFIIYKEYLEKHPYEWILMTDASDVYFNSNPLDFMSQNQKNTSLYLSPDIGTFESNEWMKSKMKHCYPERVKSWIHEWKLNIFNAGVWGGHKSAVSCVLNCITNDLTKIVKGRGNCNMGTVNWCIRFGNCTDKKDLEIDNVKALFVNPFRKDCDNRKYSIVHNKCAGTEGKICALVQDNAIHYKSNGGKSCNDVHM